MSEIGKLRVKLCAVPSCGQMSEVRVRVGGAIDFVACTGCALAACSEHLHYVTDDRLTIIVSPLPLGVR